MKHQRNMKLYFWLCHIRQKSSVQCRRRILSGDSCGWRFTLPLHEARPKQQSSQPLHRILDSGENECRAEERTWAAFRLSQGVNYDFPSKAEPREIAWTVIHQTGCLHPPEQCVTSRPKEGQKRGDFHLHAHMHISQIHTNTSHSGRPLTACSKTK